MPQDLNFGLLENGPHINLIRDMATKCYTDSTIQAIWVGGSLASGTGDDYSDIDFRIAVEPSQLEHWANPNWEDYLPIASCGGTLMRFGEQALLHHLILEDGTILDFYVQDTARKNIEPAIVVIACKNEAFGQHLATFKNAAASLTHDITAASTRQFLIDYWITTHKEAKGLGRHYDYSHFVGLYHERVALLRAWHMDIVGKDINARFTIHVLGKLHEGLRDKLTKSQEDLLGLPTRTVEETVIAIEAIRKEMTRVGNVLAKRYNFDYPDDLEKVVLETWHGNKEILVKR